MFLAPMRASAVNAAQTLHASASRCCIHKQPAATAPPPTSHASFLSLSPWLISSSVRGLMAAPLRVIWGLKEGEREEERAEL